MEEESASMPLLPEVGVVGLVPERWTDTWQPRHQIMSRLASYFHVVWVEPALEWRELWLGRNPEVSTPWYRPTSPRA